MTEQLNIAELRKIAADFAECERHIDDLIPGAPLLTTPAATALRALPALLDAAEERDALRTEIEAAKLILPVCCGSLADAADTLRQERDALKAKVYDLKSRICKMDCRYTMGDKADISGSHCGSPCDRCEAERDYEALRAERDEWKALYQAAVRHAAKKPF